MISGIVMLPGCLIFAYPSPFCTCPHMSTHVDDIHVTCSCRTWDAGTCKELRKFEGHRDFVRDVSFSSSGKTLVSGSNDRTIRWDAL